jgi:1,2-phenylacetyl-CoA epoxidase PaaB subunit
MLVAALGIDGEGHKHPLALIEGATENAAVTRSLPMCSPSIWMTKRSSLDRSDPIHSASRSADRATNRYPYEVRKEDEYFDDIPDEKIPKDMMELASHIVDTKSRHSTLIRSRITTRTRSKNC